jgi:Fe-S-cluster-containing dehydrogenase component
MSEEQKKQESTKSNLSRREFIAAAGVAATALVVTPILTLPPKSAPEAQHGGGKHKWGMLIDMNTCIGCNYCTYACQAVNDLPGEMLYNIVTTETTQNGDEFFLSRPCMHCEDPPCVHVCPVEATYVRDDGIVTMDYDLCIGCRYCEVACPYEARVFNWNDYVGASAAVVPQFGTPEVDPRPRGVMEKCTFCQHRIDPGLERGLVPGIDAAATPACVVACPTGARVFGDLNDAESPISLALESCKTPIRLREDLSTEPKVYYIPPKATQVEEV